MGPALQIFDAIFIGRVVHQVRRTVVPLITLFLAYVAWVELYVHPRSELPIGSVTYGLPYRFLISMELSERLVTYATYGGVAVFVLATIGLISEMLRKYVFAF